MRTPIENVNRIPSVSKESTSPHLQNNNNGSTKLSRNKISAIDNNTLVNDNQKKNRTNTVTTTNTTIPDSDVLTHRNEITTIQTPRIIKVVTPKAERQRRSRSNDASIDSKSITSEYSSRVGTVNVMRVRRLTANVQPKQSYDDNGVHSDNKVTVIAIPRRKSKTRSHTSRQKTNTVNVAN